MHVLLMNFGFNWYQSEEVNDRFILYNFVFLFITFFTIFSVGHCASFTLAQNQEVLHDAAKLAFITRIISAFMLYDADEQSFLVLTAVFFIFLSGF